MAATALADMHIAAVLKAFSVAMLIECLKTMMPGVPRAVLL